MANQDTSPSKEKPTALDAYQAAKRIQVGRFFAGGLRDKGWSQTKLAKAAGCTQSMVSKVCTGQVLPSSDMQGYLLEALGLPLDSIDNLPGLGFAPGSTGYRLKLLIIRALVAGDIPADGDTDARSYIEDDWDYPAFREISRTRNLDDAVWASLAADHYFRVDDEGRYSPMPLYYDLKGNLLLYIAAMASAMSRVRDIPPALRPKAIAEFDKAFESWQSSLDQPEELSISIDACAYSLAAGDRMMLSALLGHATAIKFFLEVGLSVTAGDGEHYETIVKPFFVAIGEALSMARRRMISEDPDPTRDLMKLIASRIDAIIDHWKSHGMASPSETTSDGPRG